MSGTAKLSVLDLQLPGLSGLDLQKRMAEIGRNTPIVFVTAMAISHLPCEQ